MLGQDQNPKHYDLIDRIGAIEETLKRLGYRDPSAGIGFQVLPDGSLFAQGGLTIGGGGSLKIIEPFQMPVPTNVTATSGSSFDTIFIDVSWDAPTGLGSDQVASYFIQATKGLGVPIETTVNSGYTTTRIQPVEPNTTYTIRVASVSRNGRNSSVGSTTITTGGDTTAPATPTFPSSPVQAGILALSVRWNPNTEPDTANGKGQYRVVASTHSDLSSPAYDQKTGGTVAWVPNLDSTLSYYVGVYAIDSSGNQSVAAGIAPGGPFTPLANVTDTSAFAIGGGNIARNSGFEDPTFPGSGWTIGGGTWSKDTTTYHGGFGNSSAMVTGTSDAYLAQTFDLTKGTWMLSIWVKANAVVAGTSSVGVLLNWETITGTVNGTTFMGTDFGPGRPKAGLGTYDWTRLAVKLQVTTSTAQIKVYPQRGFGGTVSGTAWFDELQMEQGDALTGYAPRPDEILAGTIKTTMIADNQITSDKIVAHTITAGQIAANTIGASEIFAHSITAGQIAGNTITGNEIAANTITGSNIHGNTITGDLITANTISTGNLQANSVTANELSAISLTAGKFIESTSYVSNTSGWHIGADGNAEFNSVSIRGTINAAKLGSDLFDFIRPGGNIAARFYFTGTENRFYLGEGMVNAAQYIYYDTVQARMFFKGGISNNPAWEFSQGVHFADWPYARRGYVCGRWTTGAGYFVGVDDTGNPDTSWGVAFGSDGGAGFTNFLQGYLDSTSRKVGIGNVNGGVGQVFVDCTTSNPADTRSMTRTGWITYSDPKSKTNIRALSKGSSEVVRALKPIRYKVRHQVGKRSRVSSREHFGFSAEDVKAILPEAVHEDVNFHMSDQGETGLGIQYDMFIPLLTAAFQEQHDQIDSLLERIDGLEERLSRVDS